MIPQIKARFKRLVLSFIAKKYVAWITATALLYVGKISGTDWVLVTSGIFVIDVAQKYAGLDPTLERRGD